MGGYLDPSGEFVYTVRAIAEVAELAYARKLKIAFRKECGFNSHLRHKYPFTGVFYFNILKDGKSKFA